MAMCARALCARRNGQIDVRASLEIWKSKTSLLGLDPGPRRPGPKFLTRKVGRLTRRPTISLSVSAYTQPTCTTRFCASASDAVVGCAGN